MTLFLLTTAMFLVAVAASMWSGDRGSDAAAQQQAVNQMTQGTGPDHNWPVRQMTGSVETSETGRQASGSGAPAADQISVEELVQLSLDLKRREQALAEKQEISRQEQVHQKIVLSEIEQHQQAVQQLQSDVQASLGVAESLIDQLRQARQELIDERTATAEEVRKLQSTQQEFDEQQLKNSQRLAEWLQDMDEAQAAEVIREMANDGQLSVAIEILSQLEERDAAGILTELDDAKLVQQIVTEFRNFKTR